MDCRVARFFVCLAASFFPCAQGFAMPQGMRVVQGAAAAEQNASSCIVETQDNTVLSWEAFSIGALEAVHFSQKNASSAVLNRVTGSAPSEILGKLSSNGRLFLLNPHGILIGPGGRVEAAAFFASTLEAADASLLEGSSFVLQGESPASIQMHGAIECAGGTVCLAAKNIETTGSIRAGSVILAAGQTALFQPDGFQRQFFYAAAFSKEAPLVYQSSISQSGTIEAAGLYEADGGEIVLLADRGACRVEGTLSAAAGGRVHLFGEKIDILEAASLDASGPFRGGEILIGGDFQGENPSLPKAERVFAARGASLRADAAERGPGGKIVVWAEETTVFAASASARGGPLGGDGGLVEVSAPSLFFSGIADVKAPKGKTGTLLLDPTDVTISSDPDSGGSFSGGGPNVFTPSGNSNTINVSTLATNLGSAHVVISTVGSVGSGPESGSITVLNPLAWVAETSLTLTASSFLDIQAAIENTNLADGFNAMVFTANGLDAGEQSGITVGAPLSSGGGGIVLSSEEAGISLGAEITTRGGPVSLTGAVLLTENGEIDTTEGGLAATGGAISFTGASSTINGAYSLLLNAGTAGAVTFGAAVGNSAPLTSIDVSAAEISVRGSHTASQGPMAYTGDIALGAAHSFVNTGSSGGIEITGNITGNYSLILQASASTISVEGNIDTSGTGTGGAPVTASASGDMSFLGRIDTQGGDAPMAGDLLGANGSAGASVMLTSHAGSITVFQIDASGGAGTVQGGNAGSIFLQPTASSTTGALGAIPAGRIFLTGIGADPARLTADGGAGATLGTSGIISLGAVGRSGVQSIATIVSSASGNDIFISCGTFEMERFEAMTAFGSIEIEAKTVASLGDLVASEDISISSSTTTPTILLLARSSGQILDASGALYETSALHIAYGGTLTLEGTLSASGSYGTVAVPLSTSDFETALFYAPNSWLLNYDEQLGSSPSAASSVPSSVIQKRNQGVTALLVAQAELTDRMKRLYDRAFRGKGKIRRSPKSRTDLSEKSKERV